MKRNKQVGRYCKCFLFSLGSVLTCMGLFILLNFPPIYDYVINSALDIRPGTAAYEAWRTNEPPLILDFYFFNWTNAKDVYNKDVKPHFQEVGPYRFKEVKEKVNISFHENNTVSYQFVKRYYFMEEESPKQLNEVINTINPVATTAAYKARFFNIFAKTAMSFSMSFTSDVYVTKTIDELLFSGYDDKLLNMVRTISPFMPNGGPVSDKFGWFYKRNNTYGLSGDFSMYTGHDENFGRLLSWNYRNRTDFYADKCGEIHGSAGEFHPINRARDSINIYSSEMCTFAHLEYEDDVTVKGVNSYKFSAQTLFDNGTKVPEYACYCNGECIPSGVLNISACRMNAPIFLSLPHFYNADPYYVNIIDGMTPSKEKHDFYITLEPKTAIVVDIGARMQLNVLLQPVPGLSLFENVPKIYVPVFYFDQIVTMADDLAFNINILQNLPDLSKCASYIFISIGIIFMMLIVMMFVCLMRSEKEKKNEYKIPQAIMMLEELPLRIKSDI